MYMRPLIFGHRRSENDNLFQDICGLTHRNPLAIITQGPEVVPPVQSQIQKNTVKYIWPTNHHTSRRPSYRFHSVLPSTLGFALVQQQKETYHIHVFSSPLYSSVCEVGAFSIISSLRSSGATNGTRIQNCTQTINRFCTLFRTVLNSLGPESFLQLKRS